jgi:hypothetical protein
MPQFKRACRLCGKQVSSVSGLTRHTEVCQKKRKALREMENVDRPIPILSQTIQLEPTNTKSTSSTLEESHNYYAVMLQSMTLDHLTGRMMDCLQ